MALISSRRDLNKDFLDSKAYKLGQVKLEMKKPALLGGWGLGR